MLQLILSNEQFGGHLSFDQPGDYPDPGSRVNAALLRFSLLSEKAPEFIEQGWASDEIFWSRYYWFLVAKGLQLALSGPDAGLEQQALQLLEHPQPQCEPDWINLELVERSAHQAVASLLERRPSNPRGGA